MRDLTNAIVVLRIVLHFHSVQHAMRVVGEGSVRG